VRTRIKTESFERLLTAAIGEVLWTRKLLPSECFETVEFEATFAGAPKGTLHRISPVDEVTSRVKAGKLFRWAKDACSAVKQKVLAKFAICILDHERHEPLETYNFYFSYLPHSILFKADSEIVQMRVDAKDSSVTRSVSVCRTTDGRAHPRSKRPVLGLRVWGRPKEPEPKPFTIEGFLSLFAACGEMPEDYYLSHALFYNDSEAAKDFKPSSDFTSVDIDENGDADGGFNAFLAARAAAIGAATAQAAGGAAAQPTGGAAAQPAAQPPAAAGQQAGTAATTATVSTSTALASPRSMTESPRTRSVSPAPASTQSSAPLSTPQTLGLSGFGGGGAGGAGAGAEATAGAGLGAGRTGGKGFHNCSKKLGASMKMAEATDLSYFSDEKQGEEKGRRTGGGGAAGGGGVECATLPLPATGSSFARRRAVSREEGSLFAGTSAQASTRPNSRTTVAIPPAPAFSFRDPAAGDGSGKRGGGGGGGGGGGFSAAVPFTGFTGRQP
jgi:hypothetical protein